MTALSSQIYKDLQEVFGEAVHAVARPRSSMDETTDGLPVIGFTMQEYDKNLFLRSLFSAFRNYQLSHNKYFSFYVNEYQSNNPIITYFKISVKPVNLEISEDGLFPILLNEVS